MEIRKYIDANERIYNGKKPIKYIFYEGSNSNKLIITFPGFSSANNSIEYDYINTLMNCDCHKLFILDDHGPRGSYLIGTNRGHSIEESVVSLILSICNRLDIKKNDVILQGSSKGGYCALYFGIKYEFGYVIAGVPQTKLGNYLIKVIPEVAEYIAGGKTKTDIQYLNSLLYDLLDLGLKKIPEIFIHAGVGDHYLKEHVIDFIETLDKKRIKYNLDLSKYYSHTSTGMYYSEYLLKTLNNIDSAIINLKPPILETTITSENGFLEFGCDAIGNNLEYAFYIFKDNEIIEKIYYQNKSVLKYPIHSIGIYKIMIYVRENNDVNTSLTDEIIINYYFETIGSIQRNNRLKTEQSRKRSNIDIDIHGSCVSRDIFNFDYNHEIVLGKYIARNSFLSSISEPFPKEFELDLSSPWQKRIVEIDLRKELFEHLSHDNADFLLIDFIDERLELIKYKNSLITFSMEAKNSNLTELFKGELVSKFSLNKSFWKKAMDQYIKYLLKIYDEENIIIHETYFVNLFIDNTGKINAFEQNKIDFQKKINVLLENFYDHAKTKLPKAKILNIFNNHTLAYEDHRWGLSQVHYEDKYYESALKLLKQILNK